VILLLGGDRFLKTRQHILRQAHLQGLAGLAQAPLVVRLHVTHDFVSSVTGFFPFSAVSDSTPDGQYYRCSSILQSSSDDIGISSRLQSSMRDTILLGSRVS
jgi:hypothetical protein